MTPAVKALIWANVGVFVVTTLAPSGLQYWLGGLLGLTPARVFGELMIWQPVTYLFVHGGIGHILINMLILWMFGVQLERLWGTRFFLRYYFVAGVGAAIVTMIVSLLPFSFSAATYATITIGASGAIYGLLMAFALYYPETPILMFLLFPVPAKYFVLILGAVAFVSAPRGGGVAHITHLGGLVAGYLYLRRLRGMSMGRLGIWSDIRSRYLRWKMARLRRRFDVYPGGNDRDWKRAHDQPERVVDGLGLMSHPSRHMQDFPFPHRDIPCPDPTTKHPLEHVDQLLVIMGVHRDLRAPLVVRLHQHLPITDNDLPGDHGRHPLQVEIVPAVQCGI
jgi:membrane associated rhomboid family serine protease